MLSTYQHQVEQQNKKKSIENKLHKTMVTEEIIKLCCESMNACLFMVMVITRDNFFIASDNLIIRTILYKKKPFLLNICEKLVTI